MARTIRSRAIAAFFLLTLFGLILPARAATITVDSATDDGTGGCTLREAVESAETDAAVGGCATGTAGSDTIIFDAGLTGMTITLTQNTSVAFFGNTAMDVNTTIIIDGSGAPGLVIDANGDKRHFRVNGTGDLTLQFITLTGGLAQGEAGGRPAGPAAAYGGGGGGAGFGGAIYNNGGTLAVANSTLMGNTAQGGSGGATGAAGNSAGGGPNGGTLTLPRGPAGAGGFGSGGSGGGQEGHSGGGSGVGGAGGFGGGGGGGGADSDPAPGGQPGGPGGFGGGNGGTGSACSICGDNAFGGGASGGPGAGMGGGIFNQGGTVTVRNSTISGNTAEGPGSASGYGGGIFNYNGTLTTTNVTVNNNTANDGGGIYNMGDGATATATINNTIVANSSAGDDFVGGTLNAGTNTTSGVGNLMENHTGFTGTVASTSDPDLGALADNGGSTQTHLQSDTSPVVDGGNTAAATGLTTDQRGTGFPRVEDGTVDIGAVERSVCDPLIVTNTSNSGCGSLREAISAANSMGGLDTITFNISGAGPHVITPSTALPNITGRVVIDGSTQPGNADVCALSIQNRPAYAIVLDGNNGAGNGLTLNSGASGSTIRGLNIRDFANQGIRINNSNNNVIECNFIGTNEDGTAADANSNSGILSSGDGNRFGTNGNGAGDDGEGNLISGNSLQGIRLTGGSMNNVIAGNHIGTTASSTVALGNGENGVALFSADTNTIGGDIDAESNVISGNGQNGVLLSGATSQNNTVAGNHIGTDATGTADLGNLHGVQITDGANGNTIGGTTAAARNVISFNTQHGVLINAGSPSNTVAGNYIGTTATGTGAAGNGTIGVRVESDGSIGNVIGGTTGITPGACTGSCNVIAYHAINDGVSLSGTADNTLVQNNWVGVVEASGATDAGNQNGINVNGSGETDTITITGNVVGHNSGFGIRLEDTSGNVVQGNVVGLAPDGTTVAGNGIDGVRIEGTSTMNTIGTDGDGTSDAAEGNLISGNEGTGVFISGTDATGNKLLGNMIGTDASGTADLGNSSSGVYIEDAPSNEIGGTGAGEGNTIAFNGTGVVVESVASLNNAILSNTIFENTQLGIDLGDDAVTANDPGDGDDGPNKLQNWPLVTTITDAGGGNFEVTYSVDTDPAEATYPLRVEFFTSDMDEEEGQTFIGFDTYTTGDFATGEKTITLTPGGAFSALVATATDDDGNTSEFSVPLPVLTAEKTFSLSEGDDGIAQPGETISYTITITNNGSGTTSGFAFTDDALDPSLALACATVTPTPDTCTDGLGGSFSYDPGTLAEIGILGDMVTITFDAVVENPISVGVESVSNQGTASGDNFPDTLTDDPDDPTSSADPTVIPVDAAAVVMATKTDALVIDHDGDGRADPGDTIEYTITVTNTGDQDVADVLVTDTVDPHTELECPVSPGVGTQVSCTPGAGGTFVVDLTTIDGEPRLLTPKASEALTFRVVVASPFPAGTGTVENQATVEYTGENGTEQTLTDDPETSAPMDPTATEIDGSADLLLRKTASTPTPDYLSNVVFTLTLENLGPVNGASAEVKDELPKGLVFVSATGDGSYNAETGRWDVAGIDVGTPVSIQITVRVETTEPVVNTATITKAKLRDENTSNNTASATITPVASDLSLEKRLTAYTEDASLVTATFTLTATNEGPSDATGVVVTDLLDEDATLVATSFSDATDTYNAATGAWAIGTLGVGDVATLAMTITADARSFVLNYAEIAGDQVDQNARNNVSAVVIGRDIPDPARFRSDLSLEKTVSEANPPIGSQVVYTLTVANGGPFTTAGVEVTDLLPSGVTFISAQFSDEADSYDAETGLWLVGALPDGAVAQLQITVEVTGSGEITNTAEVTGNHLPDVDSELGNGEADEDDQASATISVGGVAGEKATETETSEVAAVPTEYALYGNYPNPFNPQTTIPYGVPEASQVRLSVYDLLGREVAVLVSGTVAAGRYEVVWEAGSRPTGMYLVRLEAKGRVVTRRVTLMK